MKRSDLDLRRQSGNRWIASGITAREAIQLYEIWNKLDKLANKKSLWVRLANQLAVARDEIRDVIELSGRLK